MNTLFVLLNATSQTATSEGQGFGAYSQIIMMVAIVAIFYFFMIRPQSKKQKEIANFRNALKEGDHVITAGGVHGKVKKVDDLTISLEVAANVVVKFDKSAIVSASDSSK